jgi:general stress protein 26
MDAAMKQTILELLHSHNVLRLGTLRGDGYPQVTTVEYANDDLTLYVVTDKNSQKAYNIRHHNKVSLAIDRDYADWNQIRGLSMAATAEVLDDRQEIAHALALFARKFPAYATLFDPKEADGMTILRITPRVISVLDYTREFGHSDEVTV